MNRTIRTTSLILAAAVAAWAGAAWTVAAVAGGDEHQHKMHGSQSATESMEGHSHEMSSMHGGKVAMTKHHHWETSFAADGIRVYMYSAGQAPMMMEGVKGEVTLKSRDGKQKVVPFTVKAPAEDEETVYFCPMHSDVVQKEAGTCKACGGMKLTAQSYLFAPADLSKVEPGTMKAIMHVQGMKGDETEVTFTEAYDMPMMGQEEETEHGSSGPIHSGEQGGGHGH